MVTKYRLVFPSNSFGPEGFRLSSSTHLSQFNIMFTMNTSQAASVKWCNSMFLQSLVLFISLVHIVCKLNIKYYYVFTRGPFIKFITKDSGSNAVFYTSVFKLIGITHDKALISHPVSRYSCKTKCS